MIMNEAQRSSLFEELEFLPEAEDVGPQLDAVVTEIEAVARKTKSMSMFSITEEMIGSDFYIKLLQKSSNMGVMAAIHKRIDDSKSNDVFLFFVTREESWRIPAFISMQRAYRDYVWSDGAEFLEGSLLGYSESQMSDWINAKKRKRIGWLGLTCYFLVSHAQRNEINRLANRCIDPSSITEDIEVFFNTDNMPPKENARELLPEGMNICRASINFGFFKRLFARDMNLGRKVSFFVSALNSGNANDLNESLESNFQFLGG
jgi:hypothetical protein